MAVDFTGHPLFPGGFNAPTRFEGSVYDCEVIGKIPSDLNGHFYRLQCDFVYPPPKNEWGSGFNGDGHVSVFKFANGSVDYIGKFVDTDRLKAEKAARKRLFGVYRNRSTDDPSVRNIDRGAANTHLFWHGGKMMVLKEDALPYTIDPYTLETHGRWDFAGKYKATSMSAHPKIDPMTGDMIAYGYEAKGDLSNDVAVYFINPKGEVTRELWFKAPYVGMIHDIAFTPKHILFPVVAMVTSQARLDAGEPMWQWDATKPTMVGVLPRDGDAKDIRWFKGPNRNTLHFLNAVEQQDGRIFMDLPVSDAQGTPSQLKRWIFDMKSRSADQFGEELIHKANGPLIRMDERFGGQPYRYGWVGNRDPSLPWDSAKAGNLGGRVTNTYNRVDFYGGSKTGVFFVGPVSSLQEAGFVPRRPDSPEGDGYILGVTSNYAETRSDLVILDAMRMEDGIIATVKLPFRLRSGTHTKWVSAEGLKKGSEI